MKRVYVSLFFLVLTFGSLACSKSSSTASTTTPSTSTTATQTNVPTPTAPSTVKTTADGSGTTTTSENLTSEKPLDPKDILPPTESIKHLDDMVAGYHLGQNLTPDELKQNTELKEKIIRGTFDIRELCRLSLGKHWDEINADQRNHFVELMTKLLETKAIFSKEQLHGENKLYNISYQKETYDDAQKKKATVGTKMNVPKEKMVLGITYKMLLTPFGWKIYDVIVDDASLLSNYKFQFDRIITTSGYDDLITRMNKKLSDISK